MLSLGLAHTSILYGVQAETVGVEMETFGAPASQTPGTITVSAMPAGATAWSVIATFPASQTFTNVTTTPGRATRYRAFYSGGTSASGDTYSAAYSNAETAAVERRILVGPAISYSMRLHGTVAPAIPRGAVTVIYRLGGRATKTFRVPLRHGRLLRLTANVPCNTYVSIVVPRTPGVASTYARFKARRWEPVGNHYVDECAPGAALHLAWAP